MVVQSNIIIQILIISLYQMKHFHKKGSLLMLKLLEMQ